MAIENAASAVENYSVEVGRREMVSAALPLQEHWLAQSNLDLLLPPVNVSVFFCYSRKSLLSSNVKSFSAVVAHLKASLSQALVSFYPFAGRLVTNTHGEPELLCNNEGAGFSQAFADADLEFVDFSRPDVSVEGKLVPARVLDHLAKDGGSLLPLLCVQVTSFKCGGVVVGCTFDHRIADAYSANMFFTAWSDISRNVPPALTPTFRRSHLNPRRPYHYAASIDDLYVKLSSISLQNNHSSNGESESRPLPPSLASKIYYLEADKIEELQALASGNGKRRSKLEAFCAYLWRLVAATVDEKANCKMGVVVDGRSWLRTRGLPPNYFGNVLSIPFAETAAAELMESDYSQSWAADLIHGCIAEAASEEHFQSLIDWVEMQKPEPALARIYSGSGGDEAPGPCVVVSSGLRFSLCDMDFGWGKAWFASYHFPWGGEAGYVMPLPSPARDGSWIVYMHLSNHLLDSIERNPEFFLLPLKPNLLNNISA